MKLFINEYFNFSYKGLDFVCIVRTDEDHWYERHIDFYIIKQRKFFRYLFGETKLQFVFNWRWFYEQELINWDEWLSGSLSLDKSVNHNVKFYDKDYIDNKCQTLVDKYLEFNASSIRTHRKNKIKRIL